MSEIIDNPFNDDLAKWIKERIENGETIIIYDGRRNGKTFLADYLNAKEIKETEKDNGSISNI